MCSIISSTFSEPLIIIAKMYSYSTVLLIRDHLRFGFFCLANPKPASQYLPGTLAVLVRYITNRGVPIIRLAKISATDMAFLPILVSVQNSRRTDITTNIYAATIDCT